MKAHNSILATLLIVASLLHLSFMPACADSGHLANLMASTKVTMLDFGLFRINSWLESNDTGASALDPDNIRLLRGAFYDWDKDEIVIFKSISSNQLASNILATRAESEYFLLSTSFYDSKNSPRIGRFFSRSGYSLKGDVTKDNWNKYLEGKLRIEVYVASKSDGVLLSGYGKQFSTSHPQRIPMYLVVDGVSD